jgi:hypothetical protein
MAKSVHSFNFTGISADSGSSNTDFYTNDQTLTLVGSVDLNGNGTDATLSVWATSGTTHILLGNFALSSDGTVDLNATAHALPEGTWTLQAYNGSKTTYPGSSGTLDTQTITIDTTAPTELVPGTQTDHRTAPQNGNLVFSGTNGNAITVADNNTDT